MVTPPTKGIVTTTMLSSIPVNRNDSTEPMTTVMVKSTKVLIIRNPVAGTFPVSSPRARCMRSDESGTIADYKAELLNYVTYKKVIPAQAGIQYLGSWIPACAGMTHANRFWE